MRIHGWRRWLPGVVVVLSLTGCAGSGVSTAGTAAAVTDIAGVAGKWTGLMEMAGSQEREDFVELTIDGSGAYRAVAARTIGVMDARGKVAVGGDGKILLKGDRGSQATATLYTQPTQPQRTLLLEGATPSGRGFRARLQPQP
jgi:hypothetical protein